MHLVTVSLVSARTKDGVKAAQFNASGHRGYIFSMFKKRILDHTIVLLIMDVELLQVLQL